MKVAYFTGVRKLEIRDQPEPKLEEAGSVLVRIDRVGVCGSDVHYYLRGRIGDQTVEYPATLGHECSGTVMEAGPDVESLAAGDRVAIDPAADAHARRVSALLALGEPSALEILLDAMPGVRADPRVVDLTLRAGVQAESPALDAAIDRTLSHSDPEIRRAALGAAQLAWSQAVGARLIAMERADPDPRVRRDVARLLERRSGREAAAPTAEQRRSRRSPEDAENAPESESR